MTAHRRTPTRAGGGFGSSKSSLTRMGKSSSTSLRHMVLSYSVCCDDRATSRTSLTQSSRQNARWSDPPSLAGSDASVETDRSFSRTLSQSSLRPGGSSSDGDRSEAMDQSFGACRESLSTAGGGGRSLFPRRVHAHHRYDDAWGQFVDVADAEEELVRMSKFLSIRRHIDIPLTEGGPLDF
jgi:hypothetical protein